MISIPGRIPILIFPFFWFLILMIGWLNTTSLEGTIIWSIVIFLSVLIHEYGHALTARAFGQEAEINLVGLGGLTKRHGPQLARWQEFLIVLNGPIAGFMLFLLSYQLLPLIGNEKRPILTYALQVALEVNLFWTILNLLPVLPLDGGHLLRILLEGIFGLRGLKLAFLSSLLLAALVGLYFFLIQQLLMGALFLMMAFESYRGWADIKSMSPQDTNHQLQNLIKEAIEDLKEGRSKEAFTKLTFIREQAPKGILYVTATEYAAHILAEQGHFKKAYDWLFPLKNRLSVNYLRLLQQLAYRIQEWEETVKIGQQAYQKEPSIDTALINAFSYAIMGNAIPAVGWLRCAQQLGLSPIKTIIEKREFDAIRSSSPFQDWLKSLKNKDL